MKILICKIQSYCLKTLLFLTLILLFCSDISATETIIWTKGLKEITIGKYISILEDSSRNLKITEILSPTYSKNFIKSKDDVPNFGVTESAFWVRTRIRNQNANPADLIFELDQAQFDEVDFFDFDPETGNFKQIQTGDQYPFSSRPIEYYNYLFPIQIPGNTEKDYYFRLVMNGPTSIPIHIWEPKAFFAHSLFVMYFFGAFLGLMGIICVYNLFLFYSIKDISYLYYVFLVGGILQATLTFTGLDAQYLWQNSPFWGEFVHHISIIGTNIFAALFTSRFLNTKVNLPKIYIFINIIIFISFIVIFFPLFLPITVAIKSLIPIMIISQFTYLYTGVMCFRKGKSESRFYLLAWGGVIIGAFTFAGTVVNILPDNFFTRYSMQFASSAQVLLFSFALADRINILKAEREKALVEKLSETEKVASLSKAFERFVPKQFLEYLDKESISSIQLGDHTQKTMTILFCDIRSFTDLSEKMTPSDNFQFINDYLSRVGPLIRSHGGFIDKYIGDAIMALFPEKVESAIDAAISIQKEVKKFNEIRKELKQTLIHIGIGIHTGNLMLGTVGEANRMDTTVISDAVNLSSRLEGMTKELNAPILVSEIAFSRIKNPDIYPYRILGDFFVKGKKDSIPLVEIIEGSLDHFAPEKIQTKEIFEKAVKLYEQKNYEECLLEFNYILKIFPEDLASLHYRGRCKENIKIATKAKR